MQEENNKTMGADLLLLLVALIWGFGFVAQRAGMEYVGPFTYNGIRFLVGGLCLVPLLRKTGQNSTMERLGEVNPLQAGILAGFVLFAGATLQQVGMVYTTAGKAGFITDLYVIFVPMLGLLFRQRTGGGTWAGAFLATVGMYLLSVQEDFSMARGDLLVLAGAVFWALHVLLLGYLSPRTIPVRLAIVQFLVCGLISLLVALSTETVSFGAVFAARVPLLYGGLCSVGVGYTLQVVAQRNAHPAHAAIILSLEGVFAAVGGWWLLGEVLSPRGLAGCGMMLAGVLISQLQSLSKSN